MRTGWLPLLCLLGGCDSGTHATADAGPDTAPGPDGPPFAVTTPLGSLIADCPQSPPANGSPCSRPGGLQCEYGNDWDSECNTLADCYTPQATWDVRLPSTIPGQCPTPATGGANCPATLAQAQAAGACATSLAGTICQYPEGLCDCYMPETGTDTSWFCQSGNSAMCPATRPRIGSACAVGDVDCQYQICGRGGRVLCRGGVWLEGIAINMCQ
jgi:hypothetical protein